MEPQKPGLQAILARNIRTARDRLHYSQMELAERAQVSAGHMNDLEQGRKWISADSLQRIADALGLEPFMLLLPPGYEAESEPYSLLAEFAVSVREQVDGAVESSLQKMLRRRVDDGGNTSGP